MKKIVHITNDLQRLGGVQRLLIDLMTLQHSEFKFEVILTRGENEYTDELKALGVKVFHKRDLGFFGVIKRLNAADLVHTHLFPSIYIAYLTSTPTIVTEHNAHYRRRDMPFIKTLESIIYRKFKKIICISQGVKSKFLEDIRINKSLACVIHNGINLERFSQKEKVLNTGKKIINIGMVGRFAPQKDIKTLIKLMTILDERFVLSLAGDGDLRSEYEEYALSLGIDNKIKFLGQVNDIPNFLNSLDIYVQSSYWEGFGIAAVEAMASGLPTFATDVKGLNNVVDKNLLFNVGDSITLARKIKSVIDDSEKYNQTSMASIKSAKNYSIELTAAEHLKIYISLMVQS